MTNDQEAQEQLTPKFIFRMLPAILRRFHSGRVRLRPGGFLRSIVGPALGALFATFLSASDGAELARFSTKEILGLDWPTTLVTYRVSFDRGRAFPDQVRLIDKATGVERRRQISKLKLHNDGSIAKAQVSFMADLKKHGHYSYSLITGRSSAAKSTCSAFESAASLTLENGLVALRLPKPGTYEFDPPLRFGFGHESMVTLYGKQTESGIAPGPIQGLRLADGRWIGGSYFSAERPDEAPTVLGYNCQVTESGPLFVEARIRYSLQGGGFYQLSARLLADDPALRIDEQFDTLRIDDPFLWRLVLSLSNVSNPKGWRPDYSFWYSASPENARLGERDTALEARLKESGVAVPTSTRPNYGSGKIPGNGPASKVFDVGVWYPWHRNAHYFGLIDSRTLGRTSREKLPFVAVVPMHCGNWRGATGTFNGTVFRHGLPQGSTDVSLHWPLVNAPHPNSLLHTGEYDTELPLTFGRRQWALVGGPLQYLKPLLEFRSYHGYVTLDDYKDWTLEWAADPDVTYPRLIFSRGDIERLRPDLDKLSGGELAKKYLYFNDTEARREELWKNLSRRGPPDGPLGQVVGGLTGSGMDRLPWVSDLGQTRMSSWSLDLDELLSSTRLTTARRQQLRGHLAALCSLLSEPDFNPRGAMNHLGNPNMPINRFFALPSAAALIPDHPNAKEWLDVSNEYLRYKLAMNTAPGGVWSELITYFHASAPFLFQAAMVLGRTGRLDNSTRRLAMLPSRFPTRLLSPPDPRFGQRLMLGWGHEGYFTYTHWLVAAALAGQEDRRLEKDLAWGWNQLGRPSGHSHDLGFTERMIIKVDTLRQLESEKNYIPADLRSAWLPGFGAVMRAHAGDPNETCLQYRQGYMTSHCDANQGSFVLYSKGAPLTTFSLFGYSTYDVEGAASPFGKLFKEFGWHNRVRFGSQDNFGGWPGGGPASLVQAHFFDESVDYIRGVGDYPPQRWARQILFLRGKAADEPNYFVLRDSFYDTAGEPGSLQRKWWYLRTPGSADRIASSKHTLTYTSPHGPMLDARFLMPAAIEVETKDAIHNGPLHAEAGRSWKQAGSPVAPDGKDFGPISISVNETMSVSAVGPVAPREDILVVLYPRAAGEPAPNYTLIGNGVARIETTESTDYVFSYSRPSAFHHGDIGFEGVAGAVRVYPDEIHLVLSEGPGTVSYKGTVLRGKTPCARRVPIAQLDDPKVLVPSEPETTIRLSVELTAVEELAPGVRYGKVPGGFAYQFESEESITFETSSVSFRGSRGGIVVDEERDTVRLVLIEGTQIGIRGLRAWESKGPFDITFHRDRITGQTSGLGRFVLLTPPEDLDRLPMLIIDGNTYAPGTRGNTLIVPILPGEHRFEIRALEQPPVWRNWQAWSD